LSVTLTAPNSSSKITKVSFFILFNSAWNFLHLDHRSPVLNEDLLCGMRNKRTASASLFFFVFVFLHGVDQTLLSPNLLVMVSFLCFIIYLCALCLCYWLVMMVMASLLVVLGARGRARDSERGNSVLFLACVKTIIPKTENGVVVVAWDLPPSLSL
jgi:hypothetical protein